MTEKFQDCYVKAENDRLWVGNAMLERCYLLQNGKLFSGALVEKSTGKTAAEAPQSALCLPFGAFERVSIQCTQEDCGGLSEPFFSAAVIMENAEAVQTLYLELFPRMPFITSRFAVRPNTGAAAEPAPEYDVTERFALPSAHCRVTAIELFDKTDHHDTLVRTTKDSPYPRIKNGYRGDVFLLESSAGTPALLAAKDAPVGTSHLHRPEYDLEIEANQVLLQGSGVDFFALPAGEETEYYGITLGVGKMDELLKQYKRLLCRRRKGEGRLFTMANTWGDRNCEKALCEAFLSAELKTAERLGADVLQIDDGWETGAIKDPERYMDHVWEGYHNAAENYWSVDAVRFPRGLEPVAAEAKQRGISLGLWFSPDSADDFANWQADADILNNFRQKYGIRYFKLDGVNVRSKTGDRNFSALMEAVSSQGASLQLDVTAGDRFGYHYKSQYGVLFVENRYTDWKNYYPYRTLRNLWMLSRVIPSRSMQFEMLNPRRNREKYGSDPFAPDNYEIDYLFASVMVSNPLLWCELSHLEEQDVAALQKIIAAWRPHCEALYAADAQPIGEEPNGRSCTGFWASCGDRDGYLILLREQNDCEAAEYRIPELAGKTLQTELLAANGGGSIDSAISPDGILTALFSRPNQYLFVKYRIRGE